MLVSHYFFSSLPLEKFVGDTSVMSHLFLNFGG